MATNKGAAPAQQNALCSLLVKLNHLVHKIMLVIATLSIIAMIVIVTMTVVLRYCFNTGLSWAEEVPRLLVTVFAFMACAKETQEYEKQKWAEKEASSEEIVRAAGATITELTPEAFAEFQAAMTTPVTGVEGIDDGKSLYEMHGAAYQDVIDAITAVGEDF